MEKILLEFIKAYIAEKEYGPSYRDMAAAIGSTSTSHVRDLLIRLEAKGKIRRDPGIPRSIRIAAEERDDE